MKTVILNLMLILCYISSTSAQSSVVGTWKCELDKSQGFDYETVTLTRDGYYYGSLHYLNGQQYGIDPDHFFGMYSFDGQTLELYNIKEDSKLSFPVKELNRKQLVIFDTNNNENSYYHYQSDGQLTANQRNLIKSWEYYRKLAGTWVSSESIIKVIPSLGLFIIRSPDDPEFFNWGQYEVNTNMLTIKEISASENLFYSGRITSFNRQGFKIISDGETEYFRFKGQLNLDAQEKMMVNQFMQMTHRLSMSTIDLIDGYQDFIWKEVDERGNVKY